MKNIFKYIAYVFIILLILSAITALVQSPLTGSPPKSISLSNLVNNINRAEVETILISGNNLEITYTDSSRAQARKEDGVGLSESLANLEVNPAQLSQVDIRVKDEDTLDLFVQNILPILLPFAFVLLIFWFMFRQSRQGAGQALSFGRSKARLANMADDTKKKVTFKDVAGLEEVKEEVTEIVEFLKNPRKFHRLGARIPRGVLLIGPPGTGKTLLAKATANEAGVPFFYVSGSEFVEMFVGVGASRVSNMFETAKKTAPAIIFIDEIDAVGRHRGAGLGGGHDEREQTLNQILVEMDGFSTNDTVIVIAATNRPDILDPALLRPGRFDRRVTLDAPSIDDREKILEIHAVGKPMEEGIHLRKVAERTPGFSGADLANLVNEAAILAARKDQTKISQDNLFEAIEKVMLGPERRSRAFSEQEKKITAYHEAGHALVAASLPHTDPVHKVSIISRGRAGGYTLKVPSQDKNLRSKSEFEAELAVLLGGYAAEKITFDELTTGASNDLQVASDIARRMVAQYGMSPMGPVAFNNSDSSVFLGKEFGNSKNYSEGVAMEIDTEIKTLIAQALKKAKEIIEEKKATLEKIAQALLEKEVLEQKEFYALI
ncbi:MAG: cell division protein FtsH [Candidatus Yanofskybacteria bacterium CG10_big_fil_rev_8_21_14_0_10_46_23]|uniref:ATP-dependent zinc metalloprotease FtsH n=1 Tax=Candidatus Yanofskybacteria bacterium CG10_big_fil_rev_8_21_14_0_10_46_23 TaxID=1975098 RepID=A0A2H0R3G3_9BACT|nr:MAG: cell division protein FtsH [Candidatus Yanofskybacteria bacterium CG10_big_fil_rev_8_21_14_0_10_46_23]